MYTQWPKQIWWPSDQPPTVIGWYSKKDNPMKQQETLNDAKDRVEASTSLRPTNEKLLKSFKMMKIPPHIKDLMRYMIISKIKCGAQWINILGYSERAHCSFCKRVNNEETIKSKQHMWQDCKNNRQTQAWEMTRKIWQKCTLRPWPLLSIGLIRGSPALSYENDFNKDAERLWTLISMTIWSIWKSRNKNTILNQVITSNKTRETLEELIQDLIRKSWNATHSMDEGRRKVHQCKI